VAGAPPDGRPPGLPPSGGDDGSERGGASEPTDGQTFLRGAQRTDATGAAVFDTVYPGWYQGRTPHIHVKVHVSGQNVHTGQLYFEEAVSRAVYRRAPYASHGQPTTVNSSDGIYEQGGRQSTLALTRRADGYVGRLMLGVQA